MAASVIGFALWIQGRYTPLPLFALIVAHVPPWVLVHRIATSRGYPFWWYAASTVLLYAVAILGLVEGALPLLIAAVASIAAVTMLSLACWSRSRHGIQPSDAAEDHLRRGAR
jgi:hypothetical protein